MFSKSEKYVEIPQKVYLNKITCSNCGWELDFDAKLDPEHEDGFVAMVAPHICEDED